MGWPPIRQADSGKEKDDDQATPNQDLQLRLQDQHRLPLQPLYLQELRVLKIEAGRVGDSAALSLTPPRR